MSTSQPDFLRGVSDEAAQRVMSLGSPIRLASGQVLFDLGDPADRLFQLVRGRIALSLPMQIRHRNEDIVVEEKGPGDTLGWSALVEPYRFTLRASAMVDSELLAFPRTELFAYFGANPATGFAISLNVASVIGRRLQLIQTMWLREIQRVVELRHA